MLCQILTMIVMLNLLIAIIGETYLKVDVLSTQYMYQERAIAISQVEHLAPQHEKQTFVWQKLQIFS